MISLVEHPLAIQELKPVSATRLNTWLSCRLKYYFRYVLKLKSPKTAALYVGTTVHSVLKLYNRARWRKENLSTEQLQKAYEQFWSATQASEPVVWEPGEEDDERKHGWVLLDAYLKVCPIPPEERPEGVEVTVEADLAAHGLPKLMGVLDLVRSNGRIVDYKTIGQTPKDERAIHNNEVQLSIYSLLYRHSTDRKEGGRELHQLVRTKVPKIVITSQGPMTDSERTRLFRQLESYQQGIEREDYVPSPGMQCMGCSYFNQCRKWS